jgi:hypothetical protein
MRDTLEAAARMAGRSLNKEIGVRLRQSLGESFPQPAPPAQVVMRTGLESGDIAYVERAHVAAQASPVYNVVQLTETERRLLASFRRLSPGKQLAMLHLFEP